MELTLQNVRCFRNPGPITIKPLTILVGENSTGKSSFLAFTRVALEILGGSFSINFNNDPFFLGAYDQIAHYRGGRGGRARSFKISVSQKIKPPKEQIEISTDNLTNELFRTSARPLIREFIRNGSAKQFPNDQVTTEFQTVKNSGLCRSDDEHIISLARVSRSRVLFSRDQDLHTDFRNPALINGPRGSIFTSADQEALLRNAPRCL